jgi:deoxyribonuclease-4
VIRFGFAGIPLSCKGRTYRDGLIYTQNLGLNALEIQLIKGSATVSEEAAQELKRLAEAFDIELHVHAPYYTDLAGDEFNIRLSKEKIISAGRLANLMGAKILVVHPALYGNSSKEVVMNRVVGQARALRDLFKKKEIQTKIGIETMGKQSLFGSIDEVVEVCKRVNDVFPVLDFGHMHARSNGKLKTKEAIQSIFDKTAELDNSFYLIHLTGTFYEDGNEYYPIPLKRSDLGIEAILEVLLKNKLNATLISESPLLEHDAIWVQILFGQLLSKSNQKYF